MDIHKINVHGYLKTINQESKYMFVFHNNCDNWIIRAKLDICYDDYTTLVEENNGEVFGEPSKWEKTYFNTKIECSNFAEKLESLLALNKLVGD